MAKTSKKKEATIDDLALMIGKGFEGVDKRFNEVDKRFEEVNHRFNEVGIAIARNGIDILEIKRDVGEIKKDTAFLKDISEKNATAIKRLDEERIFMVSRTDRLENGLKEVRLYLKLA